MGCFARKPRRFFADKVEEFLVQRAEAQIQAACNRRQQSSMIIRDVTNRATTQLRDKRKRSVVSDFGKYYEEMYGK